MKAISIFFMLALLLSSCAAVPSEKTAPPTLDEANISQPENTLSPSQAASPTATLTMTITPTPSITQPPTEDLSFYDLADCIPKNTLVQRGTVTQVMDGDTIEVLLEDGNFQTVRYIGIDAPESGRAYSVEASQANSGLVLHQQVILIKDQSEMDQYNRLLRYVIVDHVFVNLELVKTGLAQAENYPPDIACADTFVAAESAARAAFVGIWAVTQTPEATAPQVLILAVDKREEWVDIKNSGDTDVDLASWNLVSERGHQECPLSGVIKAGETLRI